MEVYVASPTRSEYNERERFVASIDQGTSSSRFMVFDKAGHVVASHQQEHKQYYPNPGWVEHDPEEIWESVVSCIDQCMEGFNLKAINIAALGITNQRETTVVWNKHTGKAYHNAIVWNDGRTMDICENLKSANGGRNEEMFRSKAGLPIAPYFSGTKAMYMLENVAGLREAAEAGDALFGTIDTWLVWKLTNGHLHVTDVTNASRTLMLDLKSLQWDKELTSALNVPVKMLPDIRSSSECYGEVSVEGSLGGSTALAGVRISGILGDQQAALFGQTCFNAGETKVTYGTGAFLMMNTGCGVKAVIPSKHGLLTTIAFQLGKGSEPYYALEGSVAYCGSLIQWLRDNLHAIKDAKESEKVALSIPDNGGVYFVPAFSGLFAPYWRGEARGVITGLTAFHTMAHIVRAALEAAAFQVNEIIDAMLADSEGMLPSLKVDGGMTSNSTVMQFQSDLLGTPLACPAMAETTALGSAYAAGLAVGYFKSMEELSENYKSQRTWTPSMDAAPRMSLLRDWRKAVARSVNWVESPTHHGPVTAANDALIAQLSTNGASASSQACCAGGYWSGFAHASAAFLAVAVALQLGRQYYRK